MTWLAYSHLGVAKTVQLTTQPAVALAGIPFGVQPVGRLVDGSGVLSRATGVTVTASKAGGTGTLSGTLSVQTVEGVFTFTDLKMDTVTSAVTLSFASSGLTSATSSAFNVTQPNTIIGCEVGSYAVTGTEQTLIRGPYMMRADAAGSYTVTGTAVTLTGSSGWLANEPVGYTPVIQHDFTTLLAPGFSTINGIQWYSPEPASANLSIVTDATAPHGDQNCMRVRFPAGLNAGVGPGGVVAETNAPNAGRRLNQYFSLYFRIEGTDYENQSVGTKMGYFGHSVAASNPANQLFFMMSSGGAGVASTLGIEAWTQGPAEANVNMARNVGSGGLITVGPWHHIEALMLMNDIGLANGVFRMWVDGVQTHEYTNRRWRDATYPYGWYGWEQGNVWGGIGGVRTRDDYFRYAHVYVSGNGVA